MTGEFPPSGAGRPTNENVVEARDYLPEGAVVGSVYTERYERDEVCGQRRSTWRLVPLDAGRGE